MRRPSASASVTKASTSKCYSTFNDKARPKSILRSSTERSEDDDEAVKSPSPDRIVSVLETTPFDKSRSVSVSIISGKEDDDDDRSSSSDQSSPTSSESEDYTALSDDCGHSPISASLRCRIHDDQICQEREEESGESSLEVAETTPLSVPCAASSRSPPRAAAAAASTSKREPSKTAKLSTNLRKSSSAVSLSTKAAAPTGDATGKTAKADGTTSSPAVRVAKKAAVPAVTTKKGAVAAPARPEARKGVPKNSKLTEDGSDVKEGQEKKEEPQLGKKPVKQIGDPNNLTTQYLIPKLRSPEEAERTVTIVLDLDETLCNNRNRGKTIFRPNTFEFLKALRNNHCRPQYKKCKESVGNRLYNNAFKSFGLMPASNNCSVSEAPAPPLDEIRVEIVLWTASVEAVGRPVVSKLDPDKEIFDQLIYRDIRWYREDYTKDLRRLGRDMNRVVIVENSPCSVSLNRKNSILVTDFIRNPQDKELLMAMTILTEWIAEVQRTWRPEPASPSPSPKKPANSSRALSASQQQPFDSESKRTSINKEKRSESLPEHLIEKETMSRDCITEFLSHHRLMAKASNYLFTAKLRMAKTEKKTPNKSADQTDESNKTEAKTPRKATEPVWARLYKLAEKEATRAPEGEVTDEKKLQPPAPPKQIPSEAVAATQPKKVGRADGKLKMSSSTHSDMSTSATSYTSTASTDTSTSSTTSSSSSDSEIRVRGPAKSRGRGKGKVPGGRGRK